MVKVTFLPENKTITLNKGATILEAAHENGIDIPSLCQMGVCSTCIVFVEKGGELIYENFGDDFFDEYKNAKSILTCITEIKDGVEDGEITLKISQID
jgi:ferredoxin